MNFDILHEEFITKSDVKKIISSKKDLTIEQARVKEHVSNYKKLTPAKSIKLLNSLKELDISKLKEEVCVKIVDILPKTIDELKIVLSMSIIPFNDEEINKIYELVKQYV